MKSTGEEGRRKFRVCACVFGGEEEVPAPDANARRELGGTTMTGLVTGAPAVSVGGNQTGESLSSEGYDSGKHTMNSKLDSLK